MMFYVIAPFHFQQSVSPAEIHANCETSFSATRTASGDLSCGHLAFKLCVQMTCGGARLCQPFSFPSAHSAAVIRAVQVGVFRFHLPNS